MERKLTLKWLLLEIAWNGLNKLLWTKHILKCVCVWGGGVSVCAKLKKKNTHTRTYFIFIFCAKILYILESNRSFMIMGSFMGTDLTSPSHS
jgi:hypothetical protein